VEKSVNAIKRKKTIPNSKNLMILPSFTPFLTDFYLFLLKCIPSLTSIYQIFDTANYKNNLLFADLPTSGINFKILIEAKQCLEFFIRVEQNLGNLYPCSKSTRADLFVRTKL
jgi:hypothetical protein